MGTDTDHCVRSVQTVRTFVLRHAVNSTNSRNLSLKVELDSHADTCVVGSNVRIVREHSRVVNVTGFDPLQPARQAKIVDCCIRYQCPGTGMIALLFINQAILVEELDHCLLCPMQCRMNGVEINETPKFLTYDPSDSSHSIEITNPDDLAHPLQIPLRLEGVVSYFHYSRPSAEELEDENIPHFHLTAEAPDWDPYDPDFAALEDSKLDFRGHAIGACRSHPKMKVNSTGTDEVPTWNLSQFSLQYDSADVLEDENFAAALEANVRVSLVQSSEGEDELCIAHARTGKRRGEVDYISLANRWHIPLERAKKTV